MNNVYLDIEDVLNDLDHMSSDYDYNTRNDLHTAILAIPHADVKETVHARWLYAGDKYYCTHCMTYLPESIDAFDIIGFDWCPSCGSKMDEFFENS